MFHNFEQANILGQQINEVGERLGAAENLQNQIYQHAEPANGVRNAFTVGDNILLRSFLSWWNNPVLDGRWDLPMVDDVNLAGSERSFRRLRRDFHASMSFRPDAQRLRYVCVRNHGFFYGQPTRHAPSGYYIYRDALNHFFITVVSGRDNRGYPIVYDNLHNVNLSANIQGVDRESLNQFRWDGLAAGGEIRDLGPKEKAAQVILKFSFNRNNQSAMPVTYRDIFWDHGVDDVYGIRADEVTGIAAQDLTVKISVEARRGDLMVREAGLIASVMSWFYNHLKSSDDKRCYGFDTKVVDPLPANTFERLKLCASHCVTDNCEEVLQRAQSRANVMI